MKVFVAVPQVLRWMRGRFSSFFRPSGRFSRKQPNWSKRAAWRSRFIAEEIKVRAQAMSACKHCGDSCLTPISHGVPTINNIELPPEVQRVGEKSKAGWSARDRAAMDRFRP
jgi:hypothetical protein